jgi:hypothetical protein
MPLRYSSSGSDCDPPRDVADRLDDQRSTGQRLPTSRHDQQLGRPDAPLLHRRRDDGSATPVTARQRCSIDDRAGKPGAARRARRVHIGVSEVAALVHLDRELLVF